jgi:tryptophan synthase beta chain
VTNVRDTYYLIGSVVGPHPYPMIVRNFQSVIGRETRAQIRQTCGGRGGNRRLPNYIVACVGGGSNAIGIFYPFIKYRQVNLIGVEAAGAGLRSGRHCSTLLKGKPGIFQGMKSYLLQSKEGQVAEVHSISAGLDYPGVGPEHSLLRDIKRVRYAAVTDEQAMAATLRLARYEGILPALETAHALAYLDKLMPETSRNEIVVVNISGRGDKDLNTIMQHLDNINSKIQTPNLCRAESKHNKLLITNTGTQFHVCNKNLH